MWPMARRRRRLDAVEVGLAVTLTHDQAAGAVEADFERIVAAARETLRMAGTPAERVDVVYLTGGSTGLTALAQRIAAVCPDAQLVRGDRFASVANRLGLHARTVFMASH